MLSRRFPICLLAGGLLILLCMATDALATDYFVRTTGSNSNAGTSAGTAWLTISYAADQVTAGDTIYVGAGTYNQELQPGSTCVGTAINPIRFVADTDGSQTGDAGDVILTASTSIVLYLDYNGHDYLEFDGFKITGGSSHAIYSGFSTGIVFENCEVYGSSGNGLRFDSQTVTIRNCSFHDNANSGIYLYNGATGTIEDTEIYSNNNYSGFLLQGSSVATVNRCRIYDNQTNGISVDDGTATISNCLITGNLYVGLNVDFQSSNVSTIRNCTIADNGTSGLSISAGTNSVTNCILADNTDEGILDFASSTRLNNLLYGNGSGNTAANSTEIVADPQFVSSTGYHIPLLSPARNTGADLSGSVDDDLDGRTRPYDGLYDIGCYEEGPVAHWKLDETSGTTAADSSGFSREGTLSGSPAWSTTAIRSGSLDFETSDGADRVDAGNFDVTGTGLSLSAWIRQEDPLNDGRIIIKSSSNLNSDQSWGLTVDQNGELDFRINAGGTWRRVQAPGVIAPSKWYHVAGTYDGTTMLLYLNGQLIATSTHSPGGAIVGNSSHTVTLGDSPVGGRPFDGLLDDARVYDYVLSPNEIQVLYGLMGHWKLDETSGTVASDSSGLGNDGTYTNGPTLGTCGPYKNAASFDGTDDHINLPDMNHDYSEGFTASVWIKPTAQPNNFYAFLGTANGATDNEIWFGYVGSLLELFVSDTIDGLAAHVLLVNSPVQLDEWQHCVATIDALGNGKLYQNGVETASGFMSLPANINRTANFIGKSVFDDEFPGDLDDVRIYNRALTPEEVADLYGLVAHWKLDETSGSVVSDSSPNGNDGTLSGNPVWDSSGAVNGALDFETTDGADRIDAGTFDLSGSGVSIAAWIKPENDYFPARIIIKSSSNSTSDQYWGLFFDYLGHFDFRIKAGGTWDYSSTAIGVVLPNIWQHVAGTYDGTTMRVYVNGVEIQSDIHSAGGPVDTNSTAPVTVGDSPVGNREYDGKLDEVRVYSRALCPDEIQDLYGSGVYPGVRIIQWVEVR